MAGQGLDASFGWLASLSSIMHASAAFKIFAALSSLLVVYYIHSRISERVLNNYQSSDPWVSENELVLLTGGNGGIGKQIMQDLSERGVRVVILDIQRPTAKLPKNVIFYETDITSAASLSEVAASIRKTQGDPTIIVNNAGVFHHGSILEKSESELRRTFDVNTISHFLIMKEFLPGLICRNKGHVITMASIASFVAVGEMVDYCCSKASALAFHEGLRQELKFWYDAPNVRTRLVSNDRKMEYRQLIITSIVHPLWVKTPMIKGFTEYQAEFGQELMSPKVVSQAVLEHIFERKSGQIVLPRHLRVAGSLRAFPLWLQEPVRSFFSKVVRRVRDVRIPGKS
jgi:short-subunit dehydrogenase